MFWESMVSDCLLVEMYKTAVIHRLDPEFTMVMYDEIQKRQLNVEFEADIDPFH